MPLSMPLSMRALAGLAATVIALCALLALAAPVRVGDRSTAVTCGDAIKGPRDDTGVSNAAVESPGARCADAISTRRLWAWPLAGLGTVVLVATLAVPGRAPAPHRPAAGSGAGQ